MKLALKIDVDTYDGMRLGVPNFLGILKELNIRASFFLPFGPDESGKAVFRVFKKRGFLKKMFRTNALRLYGVKTALRGTFLPAPKIGSSFPDLSRKIVEDGHELGIHGYNHVLWQDHLLQMNFDQVREQFELGVTEYEKVIGSKPRSFAAPAWLCSRTSLELLDKYKFAYASDTRGKVPFYPVMESRKFNTLQIPSTLPTMDEILGAGGLNGEGAHNLLSAEIARSDSEFHVHSIHTEVEGTALFGSFSEWLKELQKKNVQFATLSQISDSARKGPAVFSEIRLEEIPGRAGPVACQKT